MMDASFHSIGVQPTVELREMNEGDLPDAKI